MGPAGSYVESMPMNIDQRIGKSDKRTGCNDTIPTWLLLTLIWSSSILLMYGPGSYSPLRYLNICDSEKIGVPSENSSAMTHLIADSEAGERVNSQCMGAMTRNVILDKAYPTEKISMAAVNPANMFSGSSACFCFSTSTPGL